MFKRASAKNPEQAKKQTLLGTNNDLNDCIENKRPVVPDNVDLQSQISKFQILSPSNQRLLAQNSTTIEKKQDHKIVRMNTQPSNAKSQQKVTAFDSRVDASPDLVQKAPVQFPSAHMSRDDWKLSESLRSNIDAASQQSVSVKVEDLI